MLFALTSLRPTPTSAQVPADTASLARLRPGEVAVPVVLASPALAATAEPGAGVDVVAAPDDVTGDASVVAAGARVLRAAGDGGFASGSSSVVLVAVPERYALALSGALDRTLTIVIRTG